MLAPRSWRALVNLFGDFTRACRNAFVGVTFGQPAANHTSMISLNIGCLR